MDRHTALPPSEERRQLTVMFCDIVGATALSEQLDPEDFHALVRTYQHTSAEIIQRFDGYIAQYLGDGILVYFGYPIADEEAAVHAVRAGLRIVEAVQALDAGVGQLLRVRVGIHTGLVMIGELGEGARAERLALGDTPHIAAQLQHKTRPNTVVMSHTTFQLVHGYFVCEALGSHELTGMTQSFSVYQVQAENDVHSRFEVAVRAGLTPLVGRREELGLLRRCWRQAQTAGGRVVLLSGEPGIGKSRLVREFKRHTAGDAVLTLQGYCSPAVQKGGLSPVIGHLQRLVDVDRQASLAETQRRLEQLLSDYHFSLPDTLPVLTALLSLPLPPGYAPLLLSPQQQIDTTCRFLVAWLAKEAERQPIQIVCEDVHWADPFTLAFLSVLVEEIPSMRALLVLTFRPEFRPPWSARAHMLALRLQQLPHSQIAEITRHVAGKRLPKQVMRQVVAKTDGVPLFAEELTKMVVEAESLQGTGSRSERAVTYPQMCIPTTLHDSLRARLDRLPTAQAVAQLGATIGREFSYALLRAVCGLEEVTLHHGLQQLVEADLVCQTGMPPHAQYRFKHALIQDTAYQSLLRSTRTDYQSRIARALQAVDGRLAEPAPLQPF